MDSANSSMLFFGSLMCSLLPENPPSDFISPSLQLVLCPVAAVQKLTVHHHSVVIYISIYLYFSFPNISAQLFISGVSTFPLTPTYN